MSLKFNLIVACEKNMGIGKNNDLPWHLKSELAYFVRMTLLTTNKDKKNVVIMGRRTWESMPPKIKPMPNRINFILSEKKLNFDQYEDVYSFSNWEDIYAKLNDNKFKAEYENIWVIGGSQVYQHAMDSKYFYRLYLTEIKKEFDCDTFFPPLVKNIKETSDPNVPSELQEEKGIQYLYKVYENTLYNG